MDGGTLSQLERDMARLLGPNRNQPSIPSVLDEAILPRETAVSPHGGTQDNDTDLVEDSEPAAFLQFCAEYGDCAFRRNLHANYDQMAFVVGGGGFSTVYRLELPKSAQEANRQDTEPKERALPRFIACRQHHGMRRQPAEAGAAAAIWAEFATELRLRRNDEFQSHPNILKLLSVDYLDAPYGSHRIWEQALPCFIYEWAEMGSLRAFLGRYADTNTELALEKRLQLCSDIGRGILGLHKALSAHTDLKPENVLIFSSSPDQLIAKIGDFGSLMWKDRRDLAGMTELWAAPEQLNRRSSGIEPFNSLKAWDYYSFGLIIWFIASCGHDPTPTTLTALKSEADDAMQERVRESLATFFRPSDSTVDAPMDFFRIISALCQTDPLRRDIFEAMDALGATDLPLNYSFDPNTFSYEVAGGFRTSQFRFIHKDSYGKSPSRWAVRYAAAGFLDWMREIRKSTALLTALDELPNQLEMAGSTTSTLQTCYERVFGALQAIIQHFDKLEQTPRSIDVLAAWKANIALFWLMGRSGKRQFDAAFHWASRAAELERKYQLPPHMASLLFRLLQSLPGRNRTDAREEQRCKDLLIWACEQDPTKRWLWKDIDKTSSPPQTRPLVVDIGTSTNLSAQWFFQGIASSADMQTLYRFDPTFCRGFILSPLLQQHLRAAEQTTPKILVEDPISAIITASLAIESESTVGLHRSNVLATYLGDRLAHVAAAQPDSNTWLCELVEEHGINIDWTNNLGETPLQVALLAGNAPATRYLLNKGAHVPARSPHYPYRPIAELVRNLPVEEIAEILELLLERSKDAFFGLLVRSPASRAMQLPALWLSPIESAIVQKDTYFFSSVLRIAQDKLSPEDCTSFSTACLIQSTIDYTAFERARRFLQNPKKHYNECFRELLARDLPSLSLIQGSSYAQRLVDLARELLIGMAEDTSWQESYPPTQPNNLHALATLAGNYMLFPLFKELWSFEVLTPYLCPTVEGSVVFALAQGEFVLAQVFLKEAGRSFRDLSIGESHNLVFKALFASSYSRIEKTHIALWLIMTQGWRPIDQAQKIFQLLDLRGHGNSFSGQGMSSKKCQLCASGKIPLDGTGAVSLWAVLEKMELPLENLHKLISICIEQCWTKTAEDLLEAVREGQKLSFADLARVEHGEDNFRFAMADTAIISSWQTTPGSIREFTRTLTRYFSSWECWGMDILYQGVQNFNIDFLEEVVNVFETDMRQGGHIIQDCWFRLDGAMITWYLHDSGDRYKLRGWGEEFPDFRTRSVLLNYGADMHRRYSRLLRRLNPHGAQHPRDVFIERTLRLVSLFARLNVQELVDLSMYGFTLAECVGTWPMRELREMSAYMCEAVSFVDWAFKGQDPKRLGSFLPNMTDQQPYYSLSALCVLACLLEHPSKPPLPAEYAEALSELPRARMKLQHLVMLFWHTVSGETRNTSAYESGALRFARRVRLLAAISRSASDRDGWPGASSSTAVERTIRLVELVDGQAETFADTAESPSSHKGPDSPPTQLQDLRKLLLSLFQNSAEQLGVADEVFGGSFGRLALLLFKSVANLRQMQLLHHYQSKTASTDPILSTRLEQQARIARLKVSLSETLLQYVREHPDKHESPDPFAVLTREFALFRDMIGFTRLHCASPVHEVMDNPPPTHDATLLQLQGLALQERDAEGIPYAKKLLRQRYASYLTEPAGESPLGRQHWKPVLDPWLEIAQEPAPPSLTMTEYFSNLYMTACVLLPASAAHLASMVYNAPDPKPHWQRRKDGPLYDPEVPGYLAKLYSLFTFGDGQELMQRAVSLAEEMTAGRSEPLEF